MSMKIGNNSISKVLLGSTEIVKIYQGSNLIYQKQSQSGENVTVTVTGYGDVDNCYITINGTKYYNPATLTVPGGTVIALYSSGIYRGTIIVDDATVASGVGAKYDLTINSNVSIELTADSTMFTGITVTTGG